MNKSIKIIVNELSELLSGKCIAEIINLETDNIYNKSAISHIIKKYIDENCTYSFDIIKSQNIRLKFISVDSEYKCLEAMSFSGRSLFYMIGEDWDSEDKLEQPHLKKHLNYTFIFIPIIKIKKKGVFNHYSEWKIGNLSAWKPNSKELKLIGEEWSRNKKIIKNGVKITRVKHGNSCRNNNNLPKMSDTKFIHLRPHGKNSFDIDKNYLEHRGVEITKQSFWLNKTYINSLLNNYTWKTNSRVE